eukprot:1247834-Pleurochrysis_carterae.AAC.1
MQDLQGKHVRRCNKRTEGYRKKLDDAVRRCVCTLQSSSRPSGAPPVIRLPPPTLKSPHALCTSLCLPPT